LFIIHKRGLDLPFCEDFIDLFSSTDTLLTRQHIKITKTFIFAAVGVERECDAKQKLKCQW
jgi:hypothetical protein